MYNPKGMWKGECWVAPVSSFQCKEEDMSRKVQVQSVQQLRRIPEQVGLSHFKKHYDTRRRTISGVVDETPQLWQAETDMPVETARWLPEAPTSEAEPEQGGFNRPYIPETVS